MMYSTSDDDATKTITAEKNFGMQQLQNRSKKCLKVTRRITLLYIPLCHNVSHILTLQASLYLVGLVCIWMDPFE